MRMAVREDDDDEFDTTDRSSTPRMALFDFINGRNFNFEMNLRKLDSGHTIFLRPR